MQSHTRIAANRRGIGQRVSAIGSNAMVVSGCARPTGVNAPGIGGSVLPNGGDALTIAGDARGIVSASPLRTQFDAATLRLQRQFGMLVSDIDGELVAFLGSREFGDVRVDCPLVVLHNVSSSSSAA